MRETAPLSGGRDTLSWPEVLTLRAAVVEPSLALLTWPSRHRARLYPAESPPDHAAGTLQHLDMDYHDRIVIDPEIRFGKPTVRGTRITVDDVLSYLAGGMHEDEILADFPSLIRDDIRACLAYAADRERLLRSIPAA